MSSKFSNWYASWRAVDGEIGYDCIISHTALGMTTAWLRIDLGDWYTIRMIVVHNRVHSSNPGYAARLSNTDIFVYDENPDDNRRRCGQIIDVTKSVIEVPCSKAEIAKGACRVVSRGDWYRTNSACLRSHGLLNQLLMRPLKEKRQKRLKKAKVDQL